MFFEKSVRVQLQTTFDQFISSNTFWEYMLHYNELQKKLKHLTVTFRKRHSAFIHFPVCLRLEILSFLDSLQIAQTCRLSKGWHVALQTPFAFQIFGSCLHFARTQTNFREKWHKDAVRVKIINYGHYFTVFSNNFFAYYRNQLKWHFGTRRLDPKNMVVMNLHHWLCTDQDVPNLCTIQHFSGGPKGTSFIPVNENLTNVVLDEKYIYCLQDQKITLTCLQTNRRQEKKIPWSFNKKTQWLLRMKIVNKVELVICVLDSELREIRIDFFTLQSLQLTRSLCISFQKLPRCFWPKMEQTCFDCSGKYFILYNNHKLLIFDSLSGLKTSMYPFAFPPGVVALLESDVLVWAQEDDVLFFPMSTFLVTS